MSLEVFCPACDRKLIAAQKYLGKRIRCPHCDETVQLVDNGQDAEQPPVPPESRWFVRNPQNQKFGPIEKKEVDQWVTEGRIDYRFQIRKEGWEDWRWADQVYPGLAPNPEEVIEESEPESSNPFDLLDDAPNPYPQIEQRRKTENNKVPVPPVRPDSLRRQLELTSFYVRLTTVYVFLAIPLTCLIAFWPGLLESRRFALPNLPNLGMRGWTAFLGVLFLVPALVVFRYHVALRKLLKDPLQARWRQMIVRQRQLWQTIWLWASLLFISLLVLIAWGFIAG